PDYEYYAERLAATLARATEVFGVDERELLTGASQKTLFDGWGSSVPGEEGTGKIGKAKGAKKGKKAEKEEGTEKEKNAEKEEGTEKGKTEKEKESKKEEATEGAKKGEGKNSTEKEEKGALDKWFGGS
ncbi:MAG: hypothetical protein KAT70_07915, partial [Thermoplasmata archaeon]|nr:hypothetical protein [Thermoplasmata archaeon]